MSDFKWMLIPLLTLSLNAVAQEPQSTCLRGFHTLYSDKATGLDIASQRPVVVAAPDGQKSLSIRVVGNTRDSEDRYLNIAAGIGKKTFKIKLAGFNGEVAWSPDSKAFAVTLTVVGGGLGSNVYAFFVDKGGVTKLNVFAPVVKDFGTPVQCDVPLAPNTAFVRWGADSSSIFLAAEVVPAGICNCMGTYRVYEVGLPDLRILQTFSQTDAKKKFQGDLGCELRDADDKCVEAVERYARTKKGY
jgi:hypothetical protein